jgi:DNA topoisomerase-1
MHQLIHNGVMFPKAYECKGFHINLKGRTVQLNAEQEEMAVAWVKKLDTEYVQDPVFVKNFFEDFRAALGIEEQLSPEDVDFSEIRKFVEEERVRRSNTPREEKRRLAEERKAQREANKEKYGYAIVDGVRVEVGNYVVEPACIFMGRGKHPLRGRWKRAASVSDVILNLSPDAPIPPGNWKEIVWQPNSMWIAKWDDKLRGVEKYVWLSDTSAIKQERDREKFETAEKLKDRIGRVRRHIRANLRSPDLKRRKLATVCFLIDEMKLRVGDEKEKDEADTVGATTLRREHIRFLKNGATAFHFLGKDSVEWHKEVQLPDEVNQNLRELMMDGNPTLFNGVRSEDVSAFLGEVMPGLTAKVFRTYHASNVVREHLHKWKVGSDSPDYFKKYVATMANLEAAKVCNHKRKLPKRWHESLARKLDRIEKLKAMQTSKSKEKLRELQTRVKAMKATRDYNLGTSLKSYIDPRVYFNWCREVNYDWKLYYPKALQRKFSWVEEAAALSPAEGKGRELGR